MWQSEHLGKASFHGVENVVNFDLNATGGNQGIVLSQPLTPQPWMFRVVDAGGERLPVIGDSYIRGNDFIARLPQSERDDFGLTLQARFVRETAAPLLLQWITEMQTRLLDSHPAVLLQFDAQQYRPWAAGVDLFRHGDAHFSVMRSRRDQAASRCEGAEQNRLTYRLFGDFLEKGVIQKCTCWLAFWGQQPPGDEQLQSTFGYVCDAPLPLTT